MSEMLSPGVLDRRQAPDFIPVTQVPIREAERTLLQGRVPCYYLHSEAQPVISVELLFRAGGWLDDRAGQSLFAFKLLQEGTRQRSSKALAEALAFYGAFLEITPGADRSVLKLHCLTRYLPQLLPLLVEMLTEASYPEAELVNQQRIQAQNLQVNLKKTAYVSTQLFRESLFGPKHTYGRILSESDIRETTLEEVRSYYENFIQGRGLEVLTYGQVGPAELALLDQYLGGLGGSPLDRFAEPIQALAEKQRVQVVDGARQSSLRIARHIPGRQHADYHKMRVLNEVFGGYFGARLMKNIREDKGYTYGIYSQLVNQEQAAYWVIGSDVGAEVTGAAIGEVFAEMERLRQEPIPAEELDTVRNYMSGSLANSVNTPSALAEKFKTIHNAGLGYDYYQTFLQTVHQVSADELQALAQTWLNPDDFYTIVVGAQP